MKIVLAVVLAVVAVLAYAQGGPTGPGRYQIVAASQGLTYFQFVAYKLDTVTGVVSFCAPASPEPNSPPSAVVCVSERR